MNSSEILIPCAVAGFVLVVCALMYVRSGRSPSVDRAVMKRMSRPDETVDDDITRTDRHRHTGQELLGWLYKRNLLQKLEENLWQAGIYARIADVLLVIIMMFAAGLSAGQAIWGDAMISIAMGAGLGSLPIFYVRIRKQRRLKAFAKQLPYALDMIKSSLEAGHSLLRGLQVVVAEFPIHSAPSSAPRSSKAASAFRFRARSKRCSSGCRRMICACWWLRSGSSPRSAARWR